MTTLGIFIFVSILVGGIMMISASQSPWSAQLSRLGKHHRRMLEKNSEDQEISIFSQQRDNYLSRMLAQAGLEAKYDQMRVQWVVTAIATGFIAALGFYFSVPELSFLGFILGIPLGAGCFVGYVKQLAKSRQARMTEQLPQALETMVSSLRSGSPVIEVFKVLAETAMDPIRGEFKRGLISLQLGKPFRDVMTEMANRIHTPDFKLLTQAIFISQEVGGNLANVVAVIADAIRERFKLRDYMNSLTAQGKATAVFVGCLPYLITFMTYMMAPGYIIPFLNNPIARLVLAALICWEGLGFWIMLKMTTFEV